MVKLTRRLAVYVGSLVLLIAAYTLTYWWGMAVYEGESRTWYQSLEIVVQSMTTTGYGQDAPWESLEMTALVLLVQVTGIAYIAVAIPQVVVPWLQTIIEPTPPEQIEQIDDHVVIVGYTALCDTLVDELEASGTPYVILEADEDRAQQLHEDGLAVLYGDSTTDDGLDAAQLDDAAAVVVDATDREFVSTCLTIERRESTASVLVLVTDPSRARYFRYAGVDEVLSPRHRLGKALGDRVRTVVTPIPEEELSLSDELRLVEFYVDPDADLIGETVASTRRLEQTGATLLGAWVRGDFVTTLSEHVLVDENTSLLVAGTDAELEPVADLTGSSGRRYRTNAGSVVVIGAGLVGRTAAGTLERADIETIVVDREPADGVNVVGDATDEETLLEAGIEDAGTLVVALECDDDAILTALTARALNPDLKVVAGVDATSNVAALRTAGATHVLALPNVAGRLITLRVFEYEVMPLGDRLHLRALAAPGLVGTTLSPAAVRSETGCTVLALEQNGTLHLSVGGVELESEGRLVVAGTDSQLGRFRNAYVEV